MEAIRTFGRNLRQLQLPEGIGDNHPGDGVQPVALVPHVHGLPGIWCPVVGYTALLDRLNRMQRTHAIGMVLSHPYDWRLSNRYNAQRLASTIERELGAWRDSHPERADAKIVFVCHSMGGLIARWYIERCGGTEVTRKLITIGTPYRGAARSVVDLVQGVRRGLGPLRLDLTDFARSMPSSYQLLPDYACVDQGGVLARLDEIAVPGLDTTMTSDGLDFLVELGGAERARSESIDSCHAIIGTDQPTTSSVRLRPDGIEALNTIGHDDDYGDGTVPLTGAIGFELTMDTNRVSRVVDTHGNLQANKRVLDEVESIITARHIRRRADTGPVVRLHAPYATTLGEELSVDVVVEPNSAGRIPAVEITLTRLDVSAAATVLRRRPAIREQTARATFAPPEPGAYEVRVGGTTAGSDVAPVSTIALVLPPEDYWRD
jgi:pimeloyl-ACP methyl ester carboxylesterase